MFDFLALARELSCPSWNVVSEKREAGGTCRRYVRAGEWTESLSSALGVPPDAKLHRSQQQASKLHGITAPTLGDYSQDFRPGFGQVLRERQSEKGKYQDPSRTLGFATVKLGWPRSPRVIQLQWGKPLEYCSPRLRLPYNQHVCDHDFRWCISLSVITTCIFQHVNDRCDNRST